MENEIYNKIILVTGGAGGIGIQMIKSFLKANAKLVILLDINEEKGKKAVEELILQFGPNKVIFIKCNVVEDMEAVYQKLFSEFGTVDVLINNAGLADEIVAENCINVNLTATVRWSLKFMDLMAKGAKRNGGTIINIASIFGYRICHFAPVYIASKYGVVGFTKSLGHETCYVETKVRVIAVCPGFTKTPMSEHILDSDDKLSLEIKNNYQWQSAEEVGEKVVEIFKVAESGSIWEIEGGVLKEVK